MVGVARDFGVRWPQAVAEAAERPLPAKKQAGRPRTHPHPLQIDVLNNGVYKRFAYANHTTPSEPPTALVLAVTTSSRESLPLFIGHFIAIQWMWDTFALRSLRPIGTHFPMMHASVGYWQHNAGFILQHCREH